MKTTDASLLANALIYVMRFEVKPHEIGCTEEELDAACNIFVIDKE